MTSMTIDVTETTLILDKVFQVYKPKRGYFCNNKNQGKREGASVLLLDLHNSFINGRKVWGRNINQTYNLIDFATTRQNSKISDWMPCVYLHDHSTCFTFPDLPVVKLQLGPTLDASSIKEGDDVYFECKVTAKPRAYKIEWKYNVSQLYFFLPTIAFFRVVLAGRYEVMLVILPPYRWK